WRRCFRRIRRECGPRREGRRRIRAGRRWRASWTGDSSGALRGGGFCGRAGFVVVAVEIGDGGLSVTEDSAADEIAGELDVRGDGLRLALHGGVVEDEIDLGFDA